MKFLKIFSIFLLIHFINSSNLAEIACKIISEVFKKEIWMKTIAIVKFENNFDDDVVASLQKCLPMEISTLLIDIKSFNLNMQRIHSPSMIVMIVDDLNLMDKNVSLLRLRTP